MSIIDLECLSCKNIEEFFDDEYTVDGKEVITNEPCRCGSYRWKKIHTEANLWCGHKTYTHKVTFPDSLDSQNLRYYKTMDASNMQWSKENQEFQETAGNDPEEGK